MIRKKVYEISITNYHIKKESVFKEVERTHTGALTFLYWFDVYSLSFLWYQDHQLQIPMPRQKQHDHGMKVL